jgi:HPt (histidine-containing phosphotransfer) domain-containing protein
MTPLPATVAVCKAVQNVLCFISYNAVYCGKQSGDSDQLNQVWTNYNSLVNDFFNKTGKWKYLNDYDIKNAMVSAGVDKDDFTIDRHHLFQQTKNKRLVADNIKQKGVDMRRHFKIWLDNFFNWINFKKHFELKGSSIITAAEDQGDEDDGGGGRAIFIEEHSGWGNNYHQIPDNLVDQFLDFHASTMIEIESSDDDDDNNDSDHDSHDNHDSANNTGKKKRPRSKAKRRNVPTKFSFSFYVLLSN